MGRSRPIPEQPLFRAPGEAVAESMVISDELDTGARCELPGCDADVPRAVGNEGRVRYCCHEHRREARALRRRARYGDAR